jgi:predicted HAD superfamily hydrolase
MEAYLGILQQNKQLAMPINKVDIKKKDTLEIVSLCILAPVLHGFVIWVLQQALKKKVQCLYFIARDGYHMYQIATKLTDSLKLPIECRYLYCSRYSLRTPLFHLDIEEAIDYICLNSIKVNLEIILKRTGLNKLQRDEIIKDLALDIDTHEELTYHKIKEIKKRLSESSLLENYIKENSKKIMPPLLGYLKQEGLLDGENRDRKYAIVDSGWTGSTQRIINRAIKHCGGKRKISGYYWGLFSIPPKEDIIDYCPYYFEPDKNLNEKVYFSNSLFEAIYSAPHGMTLGYRLKKGRYIPYFSSVSDKTVSFQDHLERIMSQYSEKLLGEIVDIDDIDTAKAKSTSYLLLKLFMSKPTTEEVNCFANLIFCDDVFEDELQPIAALLTKEDIRANGLLPRIINRIGLESKKIRESSWYEGSVIRLGIKPDSYLRQYVIYKRLLYLRSTIRRTLLT